MSIRSSLRSAPLTIYCGSEQISEDAGAIVAHQGREGNYPASS
jgi:hypothetical protein